MKEIGTFAMFALLLLLCTVSFGQEQAPAPGPPPDGSFWQFRAAQENWFTSGSDDLVGVYEILYQNSDVRVFALNGGQRANVNDAVATQLKRMLAVSQDTWKYLDLPLSEGKKWTAAAPLRIGPTFTTTIKLSYAVKGTKEISTEAGTFRTLEIEGEYHRPSLDGYVQTKFSYFYNPDPSCQCIVKWRRESTVGGGTPATRTIELIKFVPSPH
jgi:hypothetical protein